MIKRKFIYPDWEYSLNIFKDLSKNKKYAIRFRFEYFYLLYEKVSLNQLVMTWIENIASIFNTIIILAKFQLTGTILKGDKDLTVILVTKNNVYLQTLKPVILYLIQKEAKVLILCPLKHLAFVKSILGDEISMYMRATESMVYEDSVLKRFCMLPMALIAAFAGGLWFAFRPVKRNLFFAPAFSRIALTQYYFGKSLEKFFASGTKLISASDQWLWESLYFTSARNANASCYVFQHGIIGEITYPIFADQFLAWGKYDGDKMINEFGAEEREVKIIGSPHFDEVYRKVILSKTSESQFQKKYLTFLSQPFYGSNFIEPGYYHAIIERFCAIAPLAEKFGKQLIIKLHPSDKIEFYSSLPANVIVSKDPLLDVLDQTCIAYTVDSTAIFESVMYGIPVLQCGVEGMKRGIDFTSSGLCGLSNTLESLETFTDVILSEENLYNQKVMRANDSLTLYYFDYKNHGTVARVLDLLVN